MHDILFPGCEFCVNEAGFSIANLWMFITNAHVILAWNNKNHGNDMNL